MKISTVIILISHYTSYNQITIIIQILMRIYRLWNTKAKVN